MAHRINYYYSLCSTSFFFHWPWHRQCDVNKPNVNKGSFIQNNSYIEEERERERGIKRTMSKEKRFCNLYSMRVKNMVCSGKDDHKILIDT